MALPTVGMGCFSSLPGSILKWLCRKKISSKGVDERKEGWGVEGNNNEVEQNLCGIHVVWQHLGSRTNDRGGILQGRRGT